jgi:hypothetical protein
MSESRGFVQTLLGDVSSTLLVAVVTPRQATNAPTHPEGWDMERTGGSARKYPVYTLSPIASASACAWCCPTQIRSRSFDSPRFPVPSRGVPISYPYTRYVHVFFHAFRSVAMSLFRLPTFAPQKFRHSGAQLTHFEMALLIRWFQIEGLWV